MQFHKTVTGGSRSTGVVSHRDTPQDSRIDRRLFGGVKAVVIELESELDDRRFDYR